VKLVAYMMRSQAQVPMYTSCMHVLLTTSHQHIDHDIARVDARMGSGLYTRRSSSFDPGHGSSTPIFEFIDFRFWFAQIESAHARIFRIYSE
jgi:hypothetical protein